jgi:hypothetical protein
VEYVFQHLDIDGPETSSSDLAISEAMGQTLPGMIILMEEGCRSGWLLMMLILWFRSVVKADSRKV